jgi:hypothetical protein
VFVAVLAVGIGLLVLKNGFADTDSAGGNAGGATTTASATTTTPGDTTTTTAPATTPAKVIVANGSGVTGVAGKTTTFLQSKGIQTLPAVDAATKAYPDTIVYHLDGYQAQAQQVAQQLGGVQVAGIVPNPPPLAAGATMGDANVLVIVGQKPIPGVTA